MIFLIPCFFSVFTDTVEKYIFYGQEKSVKKILFSTLDWGPIICGALTCYM